SFSPDTATTDIYTLSLHDALPICQSLAYDIARLRLGDLWLSVADHPEAQLKRQIWADLLERVYGTPIGSDDLFLQHTYLTIVARSEEHTSELQSRSDLVCRLLLEK